MGKESIIIEIEEFKLDKCKYNRDKGLEVLSGGLERRGKNLPLEVEV